MQLRKLRECCFNRALNNCHLNHNPILSFPGPSPPKYLSSVLYVAVAQAH